MNEKILFLRQKRQFLIEKADIEEYKALFRDMQPGQNVYWNGFGQPPVLSFRADFDDMEFNKERQLKRELIKVRLGGNLGWIVPEDLELFCALYRKPLEKKTCIQQTLYELIERMGPMNIQQMKQETGLLVKEITPALHKLQDAFLIYEDQYDGEWDRAWYLTREMFPDFNGDRYTKTKALKIVLQRFACRFVWFNADMAKSFYRLGLKDINAAINELVAEELLLPFENGYILKEDLKETENCVPEPLCSVYALHRNDPLYKAHENELKSLAKGLTNGLEYDCEPLQYLLIDGRFAGASVGHFRNGPYDLNDIVVLPEYTGRKEEIIKAVTEVNFGKTPKRFMGKEI